MEYTNEFKNFAFVRTESTSQTNQSDLHTWKLGYRRTSFEPGVCYYPNSVLLPEFEKYQANPNIYPIRILSPDSELKKATYKTLYLSESSFTLQYEPKLEVKYGNIYYLLTNDNQWIKAEYRPNRVTKELFSSPSSHLHKDLYNVVMVGECRNGLLKVKRIEQVFSTIKTIEQKEKAEIDKMNEIKKETTGYSFVDYSDVTLPTEVGTYSLAYYTNDDVNKHPLKRQYYELENKNLNPLKLHIGRYSNSNITSRLFKSFKVKCVLSKKVSCITNRYYMINTNNDKWVWCKYDGTNFINHHNTKHIFDATSIKTIGAFNRTKSLLIITTLLHLPSSETPKDLFSFVKFDSDMTSYRLAFRPLSIDKNDIQFINFANVSGCTLKHKNVSEFKKSTTYFKKLKASAILDFSIQKVNSIDVEPRKHYWICTDKGNWEIGKYENGKFYNVNNSNWVTSGIMLIGEYTGTKDTGKLLTIGVPNLLAIKEPVKKTEMQVIDYLCSSAYFESYCNITYQGITSTLYSKILQSHMLNKLAKDLYDIEYFIADSILNIERKQFRKDAADG